MEDKTRRRGCDFEWKMQGSPGKIKNEEIEATEGIGDRSEEKSGIINIIQ